METRRRGNSVETHRRTRQVREDADGQKTFVVDPPPADVASADFGIVVGAAADGSVLMVEAEGAFVPEADALAALEAARAEAVATATAIAEWADALRDERGASGVPLRPYPDDLETAVAETFGARVADQTTTLRTKDMRACRVEYGALCAAAGARAGNRSVAAPSRRARRVAGGVPKLPAPPRPNTPATFWRRSRVRTDPAVPGEILTESGPTRGGRASRSRRDFGDVSAESGPTRGGRA